MSNERLNRNFQNFLQSIYHWPSETIEKKVLIRQLEELCRQNPEIEHIYENVPISKTTTEMKEDSLTLPRIQKERTFFDNTNSLINTNEEQSARNDTDPLMNIKIVKEGDLKVRKGSAILSSLIKKHGFKSSVYGELAYELFDNEKLIYLIIYQNRKTRKLIYKFLVDDSCSLSCENKRDFVFRHNSVYEKFTTETGIADSWMAALYEVSLQSYLNDNKKDEDIYENPDDLSSSLVASFEVIPGVPSRPPPRPDLPTNPISPDKIYVCLYDHHPTNNDPHQLEFKCGDLLYILNTEGPEFYIGHRLILPLNEQNQPAKGLVYKKYITHAYEKVF